jgi:hypothetical protein
VDIEDASVIKVNFDGWPSRWNESFALHSKSLAPFRRHSAPYTGQSKEAIRDTWAFDPVVVENLTS